MTDEPLMTPEDIARIVGMSPTYVRDKLSKQRGFPPPLRIGKLLRWKREDIAAWIESCRLSPAARRSKRVTRGSTSAARTRPDDRSSAQAPAVADATPAACDRPDARNVRMTNHPNRSHPRAWLTPPADVIRALRAQAGITQAQAAEMTRAALRTWEHWEAGERRMPAATMELWCLALAVGTVARGPYVPPGDWMRPWVRDELCLWFRRPLDPALTPRSAPQPAAEAASPARA